MNIHDEVYWGEETPKKPEVVEPENSDKYWVVIETVEIDGKRGKAKIKKWFSSEDGKFHERILNVDSVS